MPLPKWRVLIFLGCALISSGAGQYYLYDDDCLDYDGTDYSPRAGRSAREHQIIPYCRRDDFEGDESYAPDKEIPLITFTDLYGQGVTTEELYEQSVHLDLVEEYQAFRENRTTFAPNQSLYACWMKQRFGRRCQYTFDTQSLFGTILTHAMQQTRPYVLGGSCYTHLNCTFHHISRCLDWREVCDGKVDCWPDHVDEQLCESLALNECGPDEYRCFNGQCIPEIFLLDKTLVTDCVDLSDEYVVLHGDDANCRQNINPSFRCADTSCPHSIIVSPDCSERMCGVQPCGSASHVQNLQKAILKRAANRHISDECWATMICFLRLTNQIPLHDPAHAHLFNDTCDSTCSTIDLSCIERLARHCPPVYEFPASPMAWGDLQYAFSLSRTNAVAALSIYVCYNEQRCAISPLPMRFAKLTDPSAGLTCESGEVNVLTAPWLNHVQRFRSRLKWRCSLALDLEVDRCPNSTHLRCGKRCLLKHFLHEELLSCADSRDDLQFDHLCTPSHKHHVRCLRNPSDPTSTRCFPITSYRLTEPSVCMGQGATLLHFPSLCDGFVNRYELVDDKIDTDESNCDAWLCENQYTRCDGIWNCPNGEDELHCSYPICEGMVGYPCVHRQTSTYMCLPAVNVSDGIVDCVGATDEQQACASQNRGISHYRCLQNRPDGLQLANETSSCIAAEDILSNWLGCKLPDPQWADFFGGIRSDRYICDRFWLYERQIHKSNLVCVFDGMLPAVIRDDISQLQFSLGNYNLFHSLSDDVRRSAVLPEPISTIAADRQQPLSQVTCNAGVPVRFGNGSRCLCPPFLYGAQCEKQNQRVSVTVQIAAPEWKTLFIFVIYLLDRTANAINSFHQIRYLSIRDCNTKFNFHLLYSSRPKQPDRVYFVRVDLFEMITLKYRASWSFPIAFSVLPVYRLPIYLAVPYFSASPAVDCSLHCPVGQGQCVRLVNTGEIFCRCQPGWTGPTCTLRHECNCSPDSLCVGVWNQTSICVCPAFKFGRRCSLTNNRCQQPNAKRCLHGGQCIPGDVPIHTGAVTTCLCPTDHYGETCEIAQTRIDISLAVPDVRDSLELHFITVNFHARAFPHVLNQRSYPHERATTFKRIRSDSDVLTVHWQHPFHLVFAEHDRELFLLHTQLTFEPSQHLNVTLEPHRRCPSIRELLNSTVVNYPRLRRVKHYHTPCQKVTSMDCFHDDDQFICLCTYDRRANCFAFDHQMKFPCEQLSICQNGGRCFQNNVKCPSTALCACPRCYLGTRCQVSTRGFNLPLDVILGYKIQPGASFSAQPASVKASGIATALILIFGLVNGILSLMTFQDKTLRQVGSGIYLLAASIVSLVTMLVFTVKYVLFVVTHINMITNRPFLVGQCVSIDVLLKVCLQIGDWLYAAVASERLMAVVRETSFHKRRSIKAAKWILVFIAFMTVSTSSFEPFFRKLADDEEEGRIWCVVRQTNALDLFTSIATVAHFVGPFLINIVSACGIIVARAKNRWNLKKNVPFHRHIRVQFQQHKYLIMSPIGLIILAVSRMILAFRLECMKSAREPVTLFLLGYFISFLPPALLVVIFILPSKTYRKALAKAWKSTQTRVHRWLACTSSAFDA